MNSEIELQKTGHRPTVKPYTCGQCLFCAESCGCVEVSLYLLLWNLNNNCDTSIQSIVLSHQVILYACNKKEIKNVLAFINWDISSVKAGTVYNKKSAKYLVFFYIEVINIKHVC